MSDIFSKNKRSEIMSKVRSKNTKLELDVKSLIDGRIFKYQPKGVYGNPDFGNKKRKLAIFVDGCFWHGCPKCYKEPKSNKNFWVPKIQKNKQKDREVNRELKSLGWKVIRIWEHKIKKYPNDTLKKIVKMLD